MELVRVEPFPISIFSKQIQLVMLRFRMKLRVDLPLTPRYHHLQFVAASESIQGIQDPDRCVRFVRRFLVFPPAEAFDLCQALPRESENLMWFFSEYEGIITK